jgi:hypothetical protein
MATAKAADSRQAANIAQQGQLAAQQRQQMLRRQKLVQEQQGQDEQARARQQAMLDQQMEDASREKYDKQRAEEQNRLTNVLAGDNTAVHGPQTPAVPQSAVANLATGSQGGGSASIVGAPTPSGGDKAMSDLLAGHFADQTQHALATAANDAAFTTGMNTMARDLSRQDANIQFAGAQRKSNRDSIARYGAGMDSANAALSGAIQSIGNSYIPVDNTMGNALSGLGSLALQYGAYGMGKGGK